ncbi:MAG: hypothetical protein WBV94_03950 [Blastocatellia bacterium]
MSRKKFTNEKNYCPLGLRLLEAFRTDKYALIARELKTAVSAVGNYMRGDRAPDAEFLKRASVRSGYSIHWLVTGEGPKTVTELKRASGEAVREVDLDEVGKKAVRDYVVNLMLGLDVEQSEVVKKKAG